MTASKLVALVKQSAADWSEDKCSRLAAALAFYTALSLAPLLVITVGILGLLYGDDAARGQLAGQFQGIFGAESASAIQTILASARDTSSGVLATIVGVVILLFGASGVFGELQDSLNTIWEVQPRPGRGVMGVLRDRFFSFTMVLGVAFLLLVSFILSAALTVLGTYVESLGSWPILWQAINLTFSFGITVGIFALIFRILPDVEIGWRDVWVGAIATAALFSIGKYLIGLYLGRGSATSAYGAAGSVVAMLIWVYYSAQILFFGAELTQAYAAMHGSRIVPSKNAIAVTAEARARQGLLPRSGADRGEAAAHDVAAVTRGQAGPRGRGATGVDPELHGHGS